MGLDRHRGLLSCGLRMVCVDDEVAARAAGDAFVIRYDGTITV
jgi:hypothetical protein